MVTHVRLAEEKQSGGEKRVIVKLIEHKKAFKIDYLHKYRNIKGNSKVFPPLSNPWGTEQGWKEPSLFAPLQSDRAQGSPAMPAVCTGSSTSPLRSSKVRPALSKAMAELPRWQSGHPHSTVLSVLAK